METGGRITEALLPHGRFRVRVLAVLVRRQWFIRLRWFMAASAFALLVGERLVEPQFRRPPAVAIWIGILAATNLLWAVVGRRMRHALQAGDGVPAALVRDVVRFVNAQMIADLVILTVLLRFSGGVESPMSVFYLFHMLIAALLLRPLNALLQGAWAVTLYGSLGLSESLGWLTPHYPFLAGRATATMHTDLDFVLAGIGVLSVGVFGTLYFTLQISSRLDEQERELHQSNEALRRSQTAIADLQARRSRFMQTAAHQLKSPLAGIQTLAGLIRDRVVPPESTSEIVERIIRRCGEATVQVTELLTLARVQEAAPTRHCSAITDVSDVIRKSVRRFADQARAKQISLHVSHEFPSDCAAAVDGRDAESCVENLLDNAIKYTNDGGEVWIAAAANSETVSISVKDTGMGIAEGFVDDIFDPFRRGNLALAANIPGSGLGLAIVREVVEQAHGRIEVRSVVGEGSEFTLYFPRGKVAKSATAVRPTRTTMFSMRGGDSAEANSCSTES